MNLNPNLPPGPKPWEQEVAHQATLDGQLRKAARRQCHEAHVVASLNLRAEVLPSQTHYVPVGSNPNTAGVPGCAGATNNVGWRLPAREANWRASGSTQMSLFQINSGSCICVRRWATPPAVPNSTGS